MSGEVLIERFEEAIDAIFSGGDAGDSSTSDPELKELATLATELRLLPRKDFKLKLREQLIRSASTMTTTGTSSEKSASNTIVPYLTVRRAEQLVDFVKNVFGGVEIFRATGSAGGLHAEVMV